MTYITLRCNLVSFSFDIQFILLAKFSLDVFADFIFCFFVSLLCTPPCRYGHLYAREVLYIRLSGRYVFFLFVMYMNLRKKRASTRRDTEKSLKMLLRWGIQGCAQDKSSHRNLVIFIFCLFLHGVIEVVIIIG